MNAVSIRNPIVAGIVALLLVILAASTFAIVPETKQAVILRLEQPIRTINAYQPNELYGRTGAGPILRSTTVERAARDFELVFA